jgi:hypothetical protein
MPRYSLRRRKPETSFDFLKLSGEIRNTIYKLVVVFTEPIEPLKTAEKKLLGLPVQDNSHQTQPAITRVSQQLRQEALP